ncbi:MAG TPA: xylose isomerase, partial [Rectinemataceae bacterium]|nr:xylose isomerase [Rectinemataceae bacterium]
MDQLFPEIPAVKYEGPQTDNPLAFRRYDPDKVVGGKKMKDHLRFSMAFWHSMTGGGVDPFGQATMRRPWDGIGDPMEVARAR